MKASKREKKENKGRKITSNQVRKPRQRKIKRINVIWPEAYGQGAVNAGAQEIIVENFMENDFHLPEHTQIINPRYGNKGGKRVRTLAESGQMANVSKTKRVNMRKFLAQCITNKMRRQAIVKAAMKKYPEYRRTTFETILRDSCNPVYVHKNGADKTRLARRIEGSGRNCQYEWVE